MFSLDLLYSVGDLLLGLKEALLGKLISFIPAGMSGGKPTAGPDRPSDEAQDVPALYKMSGFQHGNFSVSSGWGSWEVTAAF